MAVTRYRAKAGQFQFTPLAQRRLEELLASGFVVNGFALHGSNGERVMIDYCGYVSRPARPAASGVHRDVPMVESAVLQTYPSGADS